MGTGNPVFPSTYKSYLKLPLSVFLIGVAGRIQFSDNFNLLVPRWCYLVSSSLPALLLFISFCMCVSSIFVHMSVCVHVSESACVGDIWNSEVSVGLLP